MDGALVSPNQGGGQNWPPPSFSPQTGLFYVNATRAFSVYYLYENENDDKPQGWGGNDRGGWSEAMLLGLDYQTGAARWRFTWEGSATTRSGLLSTAGNLLFAGDSAGNFVAFDAARGVPALARRPARVDHQRADHVPARWRSVRGRRGQRHAVRVRGHRAVAG